MERHIILTINAGSSSVRFAVFRHEGRLSPRLAESRVDLRDGGEQGALLAFLQTHGIADVTVAAHRVVHGGGKLTAPCVIDADIEAEITRLIPLAPLHNPLALRWVRACRAVLGKDMPQIAVFDTGFYAALPDVAATYALPRDLRSKHGLRRYGFHGLAHQAMWRRWRQLKPVLEDGGRIISLQLGAGCSVTAVDRGAPRDTSMGFSPLEGLVMATRSGDIDPGLLVYLQRHEGLGPEELDRLLNRASGLLGVSGMSDDMRVLLDSDHPDACLAVALYCYRARKYIGAYLAALGGADAILFGGGVGENAAPVRAQILARMDWCGIVLDDDANRATVGNEARISATTSTTEVWVIPVDEATVLARETLNVVQQNLNEED